MHSKDCHGRAVLTAAPTHISRAFPPDSSSHHFKYERYEKVHRTAQEGDRGHRGRHLPNVSHEPLTAGRVPEAVECSEAKAAAPGGAEGRAGNFVVLLRPPGIAQALPGNRENTAGKAERDRKREGGVAQGCRLHAVRAGDQEHRAQDPGGSRENEWPDPEIGAP